MDCYCSWVYTMGDHWGPKQPVFIFTTWLLVAAPKVGCTPPRVGDSLPEMGLLYGPISCSLGQNQVITRCSDNHLQTHDVKIRFCRLLKDHATWGVGHMLMFFICWQWMRTTKWREKRQLVKMINIAKVKNSGECNSQYRLVSWKRKGKVFWIFLNVLAYLFIARIWFLI